MTQDPARRQGANKEEQKMFGKHKSPSPSSAGEGVEEGARPGVTSGTRSRVTPEGLSGRTKAVSPTPYEAPRRVSDYILPSTRGDFRTNRSGEGRKLVVGRDISLAGEIKSCELLIVEGLVEADLKGCQLLQISDTGVFKGSAEVAQAEINGRFEGDLIITERLLLRATGSIVGSLRYNEMEIERGGRISGSVEDAVPGGGPQQSSVRQESPVSADLPSAEKDPLTGGRSTAKKAAEKTTI